MTRARLCSIVLLGLLSLLCGLVQAGDAAPKKDINDQAADAFWWGDFDELERLHAQLRNSDQRNERGTLLLHEFRSGLNRVFDGYDHDTSAYFVEIEALTRQWATEHPRSALAHAMHARALYEHAWSYRGTGYANAVPPHAWADFRKYIRLASDHMATHSSVVMTNSTSHVYLLLIGRADGWPPERLWRIALDGLKLNPADDGIYFAFLTNLLPKWGGSAASIELFVQEVVARTRKDRGMEMYARLYSAAASDQFRHQLFTESEAKWTSLKAGFREIVARYPDPANINRFAYFACLAEDKATMLELIDKLGDKPVLRQWGSNPSRTYETCMRWARQP